MVADDALPQAGQVRHRLIARSDGRRLMWRLMWGLAADVGSELRFSLSPRLVEKVKNEASDPTGKNEGLTPAGKTPTVGRPPLWEDPHWENEGLGKRRSDPIENENVKTKV